MQIQFAQIYNNHRITFMYKQMMNANSIRPNLQ
jgi:hypothetical protein